MTELLERLRHSLKPLPQEALLVAAVSGGGDSVALLHLLHALGRRVVVAHLDHALRPESAREAAWVAALAERLGMICESERVEVAEVARRRRCNLEATARELRYAFFARVARKHRAAAILTAHTQDDQAETLLWQLARGTGRATGIRQRQGKVLRPLLGFSRQELRDYLRALGEEWLEDPTNLDTALERNYLRHEVLPRLEARFPQSTAHLAQFALVQQGEDEALEAQAATRLLPDPRWPVAAFRVAPLLKTSPALRARALRQVLERLSIRPEGRLVEALERALQGRPQALPGGWLARRVEGSLFLIPPSPTLPLPPGFRAARPGDYLQRPFGKKRLVEFLAEQGVPPELKRVWPVRAEGSRVEEVGGLEPAGEERRWMAEALRLAREAGERGEVPIAAILVREGERLSAVPNRVEELQNAPAHAELLALRSASKHRGEKVLPGSTLYVTLEPCLMCYGAILEAQVSRVVYGSENLKAGAFTVHGVRPAMRWEGGWLERECSRLLRGFFARLRGQYLDEGESEP
ncbi:tRNA lysidine(34) synthetase TilS [Calidithermus roseus]|uniref:tRNA(Ile)-lysidine synthase n=1 Tax=Calidithermus roseus TaxID=1644118 RepID=A0A399EU92_9DEIN|nr:tRNA lysidine(34) synthetase TilS [Calidithermus roseus]RIH86669.1 tRNA(Ile)-lysidine synthase [Calidithermus roseus]